MTSDLQQYVSDHWGGSQAGIQMAQKVSRQFGSGPIGAYVAKFAADLSDDRRVLKEVMAAVGAKANLKTMLAFLGQRAAGVTEMASPILGRSRRANQHLELELLISATAGRLSLWRTLEKLAVTDSRLQGFDFAPLAQRAEEHAANLQRHALNNASEVLVPDEAPSAQTARRAL